MLVRFVWLVCNKAEDGELKKYRGFPRQNQRAEMLTLFHAKLLPVNAVSAQPHSNLTSLSEDPGCNSKGCPSSCHVSQMSKTRPRKENLTAIGANVQKSGFFSHISLQDLS